MTDGKNTMFATGVGVEPVTVSLFFLHEGYVVRDAHCSIQDDMPWDMMMFEVKETVSVGGHTAHNVSLYLIDE
jgi:hypothetical protein